MKLHLCQAVHLMHKGTVVGVPPPAIPKKVKTQSADNPVRLPEVCGAQAALPCAQLCNWTQRERSLHFMAWSTLSPALQLCKSILSLSGLCRLGDHSCLLQRWAL